ncbi:MAG: hypothetical protein GF364_17570 [Candidatus Lokiarchaeota archaeon]|nr:hypothetical protein [Candidatus Lokiarchaeota archaeon]
MVILTLDWIPHWRPESIDAVVEIYALEIHLILPFLYITLIIIFVLISMEFLLTRRKATNRRAGAFDNFTYTSIVFFMFFYLLYQISMYLFVNETTTSALSDISGAATGTSYLFWVEFVISMMFLFRAILKAGKSFGWNLLFLNQDAMIMGFLATIMAQTTSRLAIYSDVGGQDLGTFTNWLSMDHLLIPIIIIAFLGITIIVYYIKPQEASMFMRIAEETVIKEDKSMAIVTKFLKREFIRRGTKYNVDEIEPQLLAITGLTKGLVHSLLTRISDKYLDINLMIEEEDGQEVKYIEFISITEKYQRSGVSRSRAQKYMTSRLIDTLGKDKKRIRLADSKKKITEVSEREQFLSALGSGFYKKVKDNESRDIENVSDALKTTFDKEVDEVTAEVIYEMIKREYIRRVTHPISFNDEECAIKISEIADDVYKATKISAGTLYPLMDSWAQENWNIQFLDQWDEYGDKDLDKLTVEGDHYIDFNPISDFEISEAVQKYRPRRLLLVKKVLCAWLYDALTLEKERIKPLIKLDRNEKKALRKIDNIFWSKHFYHRLYWYKMMELFHEGYKKKIRQFTYNKNMKNLLDCVKKIKKSKEISEQKNKKAKKGQ